MAEAGVGAQAVCAGTLWEHCRALPLLKGKISSLARGEIAASFPLGLFTPRHLTVLAS